jgi:hypothetical protein
VRTVGKKKNAYVFCDQFEETFSENKNWGVEKVHLLIDPFGATQIFCGTDASPIARNQEFYRRI